MADAQQAPNITPHKLKTNQGHVSGKIKSSRSIPTQTGTLHLTVINLPSASEYEHPSTIELRSGHKLGSIGQEISCFVALRGMPNNYETEDKKTGEVRSIISARNEFQVLDVD